MRARQWLLMLAIGLLPYCAISEAATPAAPVPAAPTQAFGFEAIQRLAQQRAAHPYVDRSDKLPDVLSKLSYEDYQNIHFRPEAALWRNQSLFEVQFFHRGFTYDRRVNVNEVLPDGTVRALGYSPTQFDFGHLASPKGLPTSLGFAGFRVHYPLQRPDYKDELIVFLGASYFRVLGREQSYGASARGLALNVASTQGEEYPYFSDFWLVRPNATQRTLTIYALLDSPSTTGAYHFEVRPGTTTQVEVTATLYPRRAIDKPGLAPLTSMFLYGKDHPHLADDYRPEVHDSDGLLSQTGAGEWLWRPLNDPKNLRVSSFADTHPRGFGLAQRERDFTQYQDEAAQYQRRPSYWIAPLGDWGKGKVELVEIPNGEEIHDNIISYWVPGTPLQPGKPFTFAYLLSAYGDSPLWPPGGRAIATRTTPLHGQDGRRVMIDFAGGDLSALAASQPIKPQITSHNGEVDDVSIQRLAENGVWRVSFRLQPKGSQGTDLRCYLTLYGEALTETWTYLWTP